MSTDKPDVYIDEKAVAAVDAKIRETNSMTQGLMSSWSKPIEGLTKGPMGDITPPKPQLKILREMPDVPHGTRPQPGLVKIPPQAMKCFKRILDLCDGLEVRLTPEQSQMLLESLQSMKTPSNMMDAKAIFDLISDLSK